MRRRAGLVLIGMAAVALAQPSSNAPSPRPGSSHSADAGLSAGLPDAADGGRRPDGGAAAPGGLEKDVIAQVIKRHQPEIRFCYERRLQDVPNLAGKIVVSWTIGPDGTVVAAAAEPTDFDPQVVNCVIDRVRTWRFPEPTGGGNVAVTFPWIFKAAD